MRLPENSHGIDLPITENWPSLWAPRSMRTDHLPLWTILSSLKTVPGGLADQPAGLSPLCSFSKPKIFVRLGWSMGVVGVCAGCDDANANIIAEQNRRTEERRSMNVMIGGALSRRQLKGKNTLWYRI